MRRTINDEELGGGTFDHARLVAAAGWEAAGAAVARTHCRIPFRVRCNGRVGGVGGRGIVSLLYLCEERRA